MARVHGFKRTWSKISGHITKIATRVARLEQEIDGKKFWWSKATTTDDRLATTFPWPASGLATRPIEGKSLRELAHLARLAKGSESPTEEILREIAESLGVQKMTVSIRERIHTAEQQLKALDAYGHDLWL